MSDELGLPGRREPTPEEIAEHEAAVARAQQINEIFNAADEETRLKQGLVPIPVPRRPIIRNNN